MEGTGLDEKRFFKRENNIRSVIINVIKVVEKLIKAFYVKPCWLSLAFENIFQFSVVCMACF